MLFNVSYAKSVREMFESVAVVLSGGKYCIYKGPIKYSTLGQVGQWGVGCNIGHCRVLKPQEGEGSLWKEGERSLCVQL